MEYPELKGKTISHIVDDAVNQTTIYFTDETSLLIDAYLGFIPNSGHIPMIELMPIDRKGVNLAVTREQLD